MESPIPLPDLSKICEYDRIELENYIYSIDLLYQRIRRNNISMSYDLENLLMKIDKYGKYFSEYCADVCAMNLQRASDFRNAMKSTIKYSIKIAKFALEKLEDKDNPATFQIQFVYDTLINPDVKIDEDNPEFCRRIKIRIIRLLAYWYIPQGDALSDAED